MKDRPFKLSALDQLPPMVRAGIERATAIYNSRMLWGPMTQQVPRDYSAIRREIIHLALSRALFRLDPVLYEGFAYTVHDRRVPPCNAPHMLAVAVIEELDHAGWELTGSKNFGGSRLSERQARMALYDMLFFTFDFGTGKEFAKMGDPDPVTAGAGRKYAVDRILETMSIDHAVLSRRPKR